MQNLFLAAVLTAGLLSAETGETSVGVLIAPGPVFVNGSLVDGNATLTSGAVIKTQAVPTRVQLKGGNAVLDRGSVAKFTPGAVVLEQGVGQISGSSMEAMGFKVSTAAGAQARVEMLQGKILVAALNGPAQVFNQHGTAVASLAAGRALTLQPAVGAATDSVMTGRLGRENGRFVLPDERTGLKVQVSGEGLDREVGQRVRVAGRATSSTDGSSQVIQMAKLTRLAETEETASPDPTPTPTPNPTPQGGGGMSAGAIVAVVAIAGAAIGIGTWAAVRSK